MAKKRVIFHRRDACLRATHRQTKGVKKALSDKGRTIDCRYKPDTVVYIILLGARQNGLAGRAIRVGAPLHPITLEDLKLGILKIVFNLVVA